MLGSYGAASLEGLTGFARDHSRHVGEPALLTRRLQQHKQLFRPNCSPKITHGPSPVSAQSSPALRMAPLQHSSGPSPASSLAAMHCGPPHTRHPASQQMSSKLSDWTPGTPLLHVGPARLCGV